MVTQTGGVFVALSQVRQPAAAEDPVCVRRPLGEQPHGHGDEPQGVALHQVHHASRERRAFMHAAALQRPLQVTQAERAAPERTAITFLRVSDQYIYNFRKTFF